LVGTFGFTAVFGFAAGGINDVPAAAGTRWIVAAGCVAATSPESYNPLETIRVVVVLPLVSVQILSP